MELARQPAVVLRDLRAGAAAARVAEQREVSARAGGPTVVVDARSARRTRRSDCRCRSCRAAPTRGPSASTVTRRDAASPRPSRRAAAATVNVAPMPKRVSRSSARVEPLLLVSQRVDRQIEHRHLHPAGDVDADGVRNDRVVRSPARRRSAGRSRRARRASARPPRRPAACRRSSSAAPRRARDCSPDPIRRVALSGLKSALGGAVIAPFHESFSVAPGRDIPGSAPHRVRGRGRRCRRRRHPVIR